MTSTISDIETSGAASKCEIFDFDSVSWAWAGRHLMGEASKGAYSLLLDNSKPRPGDVAVVRVKKVGHHSHLETEAERRIRLYEGARLICVFGNRYATDVYEGRVLDVKKLHLLTASGLVGTVVARHSDVARPTSLSFVGYLGDSSGARINTKQLRYKPTLLKAPPLDVILVVGTGMSTGKTTVVRKMLRALTVAGVRVAGCKLTGSASPRDLYEMRATGAVLASDFSDYGFPSTYGTPLGELIHVLDAMTAASVRAGAQMAVIEVADGLLQQETRMLLESEEIRHRVRGVVVAGTCSSSLLFATEYLHQAGLDVWAASGVITNSPLFVREFSARSNVPVASSRGRAARLAHVVLKRIPEDRASRAAVQV